MTGGSGTRQEVTAPPARETGTALTTIAKRAAGKPLSPAHAKIPGLIATTNGASFVWEEFFRGEIRNTHTRQAYGNAVRSFFLWLKEMHHDVPLLGITAAIIGDYLDALPHLAPTKNLHLAALRRFFDQLVLRHVVVINPARTVRGFRHSDDEGKTPEITVEQARQLLEYFENRLKELRPLAESLRAAGLPPLKPDRFPVMLRDRAVIATLIYTAARAGAVAKLRMKHLVDDGTQYLLRFEEKGGKARAIPVRHNLQGYLLDYLNAAGLLNAPKDASLFRSMNGRFGRLTQNPLSGVDICRLVKRRLKEAGLPDTMSPHSFRVCTVTDLLTQNVPLEDVQYLAGHADARTTRLYDRRPKRVTRNLVEKISI
jgi:site-specific recombinase XerD